MCCLIRHFILRFEIKLPTPSNKSLFESITLNEFGQKRESFDKKPSISNNNLSIELKNLNFEYNNLKEKYAAKLEEISNLKDHIIYLEKKVQELQAIRPPLDVTEIKKRIEEWKLSTNYEAPKPVEVEEVKVEEAKTQGAGNDQDANQTPIPDASEKLTFYDGTSESEEDDDAPLNPSVFSDYLNVSLPNVDLNFEKGKLKDYSPKYKFDKPYNVFEYDHDFNDLHKKLFGVNIEDTFIKFDKPKEKEKPKTQAESDAEFFGVGTSVFEGAEEVVIHSLKD